MSVFDTKEIASKIYASMITYKQYKHRAKCKTGPCGNKEDFSNDLCCAPFIGCVHASDMLHKLPKHPNCDCYYEAVEQKPIGSISKRQPAPDVWLKAYGTLPDYYITKDKAKSYGWSKGKDLFQYAPGKMIGGDIYENKDHILPEKEGRTWRECDINYEQGKRNSLRMFYSSDGLIFYSPSHLEEPILVYWVN